ncbi:MAG: PBP1A family penicillin-binding protein [Luteitalea sp.]|nr:PBP1A family penicillin-binding protein [Luteitalea sp.]
MGHYAFRAVRQATIAVAFAIAILLGAVSGVLFAYAGDLPEISTLDSYAPSTITRVYADNNEIIGEFAVERRLVVGYDDIAPHLREAIIAAEDGTFDSHVGLSISSLAVALMRDVLRAVRDAVTGRTSRPVGASTLTQQLARTLFPETVGFTLGDVSPERKIKEAIVALQIEKRYTKREILTFYANHVHFGHGTYGVEAAARLYFAKSAKDVSLEEAALLAGILQLPARQSPFVSRDKALWRREYTLQRMANEGFITQAQADAAKKRPLVTRGQPARPHSPAPYFVEEIRQTLEAEYGARQLYENGLQVHTSLNLELQDAAASALEAGLARLNKGRKDPTVEGAVLALDNHTGQILAMVGGSDFARTKFNRAVQAKRQIGSTFKPIIYTAAVDRGYTAVSMLQDESISYVAGPGQPLYTPRNYDHRFEGPVTLRRALEQSRNVPTVRLMDALGPRHVTDYARRLGFTSEIRPYLSSALGANEASLLEVTTAFSVFPNQGVRMRPYGMLRVTDRTGSVLLENRPEPHDAIRVDTAYVMLSLLQGVATRGTAAHAASLGWPLGGKTGTTNDYTDAWMVGFDPDITIGVWVGYDQKRRLGPSMTGTVAALPIWMDVMKAHIAQHADDQPKPAFTSPGNIVFVELDDGLREAFIAGTQPGATLGDIKVR